MRARINSASDFKPRNRPRCLSRLTVATVALLVVTAAVCACAQRESLVGKYQAVSQTSAGQVLTLELQADGKGFWSVETDNAPFRWDLYQNYIRLHTPAGGVIQGTLDQGRIRISMPGQGIIQFTKIR